jgi:diguanylate cyclase (GGDEF)-like protein
MSLAHLVCLQLLMYAAMWLLAIPVLRRDLPALWHWLGFALVTAAAVGCLAWRPDGPPWLTNVGANVLIVLGALVVRRSLECFFSVPPHDRQHALVLGTALLVLVAIGPAPGDQPQRAVTSSSLAAIVLVGNLVSCWPHLQAEFGRRAALVASLPVVLMTGLHVLLASSNLHHLLQGSVVPPALPPLTWAVALVSATVCNFLFLFLVVQRLLLTLQHEVRHDPLTGLLNRRAMTQLLHEERLRLRRHGTPFVVIAMDLDHFKSINDHHGHGAGDEVLKVIAARLCSHLRDIDRVARMGGEEFIVLMPAGTTKAAGRAAAERLRRQLADEPVPLREGGPLTVTASWGVAEAMPEDESIEQLLQRADAALYSAKLAGRNQVVG